MYETTSVVTKTVIRQSYLGDKGLIVFIAIMNMFVPLSIDMYLPAIPKMSKYFGSNSAITNMTLSMFFMFYAVGMLFWGPLSDKYGRKPIILLGSTIYIISSISCALSGNIYFLILARIMQGIGAGGITSVSIAIIKDCYSGKKREVTLAITQTISGYLLRFIAITLQ
jgi:MFS transporter, DHA1 family, multidrug resistance protein